MAFHTVKGRDVCMEYPTNRDQEQNMSEQGLGDSCLTMFVMANWSCLEVCKYFLAQMVTCLQKDSVIQLYSNVRANK